MISSSNNIDYIARYDISSITGDTCIPEKNITNSIINNIYIIHDEVTQIDIKQLTRDIDVLLAKISYNHEILRVISENIEIVPPIYISNSEQFEPFVTPELITIGEFNSKSGKAFFIHELTHYLMYLLFDNETKPYPYEGHPIHTAYQKVFNDMVNNFHKFAKTTVLHNEKLKNMDPVIVAQLEDSIDELCYNHFSASPTSSESTLNDILKTTISVALVKRDILNSNDQLIFERLVNFAGSFGEHDEELIVLLTEFSNHNDMKDEFLELMQPLEIFWEEYITPLMLT